MLRSGQVAHRPGSVRETDRDTGHGDPAGDGMGQGDRRCRGGDDLVAEPLRPAADRRRRDPRVGERGQPLVPGPRGERRLQLLPHRDAHLGLEQVGELSVHLRKDQDVHPVQHVEGAEEEVGGERREVQEPAVGAAVGTEVG
jgi:hypothetical protein